MNYIGVAVILSIMISTIILSFVEDKDSPIGKILVQTFGIETHVEEFHQWGYFTHGFEKVHDLHLKGDGVKVAIIERGFSPLAVKKLGNKIKYYERVKGVKWALNDDFEHGDTILNLLAKDHHYNSKGLIPNADFYLYSAQTTDDLLESIDKAINEGVNVINISMSAELKNDIDSISERVDSAEFSLFTKLFNKAHRNNVLIVFSAGNEGENSLNGLSLDRRVITVGAINIDESPYKESSRTSLISDYVDYVAAGDIYLSERGLVQGTSIATPYVVGMLAILKQLYPNTTNDEILHILDLLTEQPVEENIPSYAYGKGVPSFEKINFEVVLN